MASTGWAVGGKGVIAVTRDGGDNWTTQESGTSEDLLAVSFVNASSGWAVGKAGTVIATFNGGVTWKVRPFVDDHTLTGVSFVDESIGWVVGDNGIFATVDRGTSWWRQGGVTKRSLTSIRALEYRSPQTRRPTEQLRASFSEHPHAHGP